MRDIRSARPLLNAVRHLEAALQKRYDVTPEDPRTDFLNAVADVAFFSRIALRELADRQKDEITACWALSAAIALGDFDQAIAFLKMEIAQIEYDGGDLADLRETVRMALEAHSRSNRWNQLMVQIP